MPTREQIRTHLISANIDGHSLEVVIPETGPVQPWAPFQIHLNSPTHPGKTPPFFSGVLSLTHPLIPTNWMDASFQPLPPCGCWDEKHSLQRLHRPFFHLAGTLLSPGGHLMLAYDGSDPFHQETLQALNLSIPPMITPLGEVMLHAGCLYIADWYWPEGGLEGPRKLRGQIPPDPVHRRKWISTRLKELKEFLQRPYPKSAVERSARKRARRITVFLRSSPVFY